VSIESGERVELPTTLLLVQHAHYEPWITVLHKGPIQTWLANPPLNLYFFFGKPQTSKIRNIDMIFWNLKWNKKVGRAFLFIELLFHKVSKSYRPKIRVGFLPNSEIKAFELDMPDLNLLYAHKTMNTLQFSLTLPWEKICLVTSSSYMNLKALDRILDELPDKNLVAGRIMHQQNNHFPSGTFRVFSRDVVELIVKNRNEYKMYLPEDLALGRLISELDFTTIDLPSVDLPDLESLEALSQDSIENTPHFRCKSGTHENREDVGIILRLHERLTA